MTLLDRSLLSALSKTFFKTVLSLVLLFVLIDLLTHRRTEILRHDVPWTVVLEYYLFLTPRILFEYQIAALAMLISTLLVLGSMAQHHEVTALLAAGIGLGRIVAVPVAFGAALTLGVFAMSETAGVYSAIQTENIEKRYFARNPERERPGISWANLPGGWTCHILKFNRAALTGENVIMLAFRPGAEERIEADRIFWDGESQRWLLEDGLWSVFDPANEMSARHTRITQMPAPLLESPEDLFALSGSTSAKNSVQLLRDIGRARERRLPLARLAVDFHGKFAKPALCFVMVWLAIPFALRLRRGGVAVGMGVSVVIGLAYLLVLSVAQGLGYVERLAPWLAAWLANGAFFFLGAGLFMRTRS